MMEAVRTSERRSTIILHGSISQKTTLNVIEVLSLFSALHINATNAAYFKNPSVKRSLLFLGMLCLRSEVAFVITCVANLMEVKVLYVQQDLRYEISSYWRFNV
jgi:hypothetical protein